SFPKVSFDRQRGIIPKGTPVSRTIQKPPRREGRDLRLAVLEGQPGDLARRPRSEENAIAEMARRHHRRPAGQRSEDGQAVGSGGAQARPDGLQPSPADAGEEPPGEGEEILDSLDGVVLVEARLFL